jgi:hypothetical protein
MAISDIPRSDMQRNPIYPEEAAIKGTKSMRFDMNKGRPGMQRALLGHGFTEGSCVVLDGVACETTLVSSDVLSFVVPFLGYARKTHASLVNGDNNVSLEDFYVDRAIVYTNLSKIDVSHDEKQVMHVWINFDAPAKTGLTIEVTTNVPDVLITQDIHIPPGKHSASIIVRGGIPGWGMLYLSANGFEELQIPIEVEVYDDYNGEIEERPDEEFAGEAYVGW